VAQQRILVVDDERLVRWSLCQRLKADGYDHSDIASVKGCLISKDVGVVELRFSRVRADGSALPPKDRTSLYLWRRFPDGWRVIQFFGMGAGASFACTSVTAP